MRISRGYRNNNPLNIRRCAKNRWVGLAEVQGDGEFCVFRSMVYGFRAAFVLLRTYGRRYGCNTLRGIISRFAPPGENDTGAYVDFVSHRVGIGADCPIAGNDADLWIRIVKAMAVYENGSEPRHEDVVSGWQLARGTY